MLWFIFAAIFVALLLHAAYKQMPCRLTAGGAYAEDGDDDFLLVSFFCLSSKKKEGISFLEATNCATIKNDLQHDLFSC